MTAGYNLDNNLNLCSGESSCLNGSETDTIKLKRILKKLYFFSDITPSLEFQMLIGRF